MRREYGGRGPTCQDGTVFLGVARPYPDAFGVRVFPPHVVPRRSTVGWWERARAGLIFRVGLPGAVFVGVARSYLDAFGVRVFPPHGTVFVGVARPYPDAFGVRVFPLHVVPRRSTVGWWERERAGGPSTVRP